MTAYILLVTLLVALIVSVIYSAVRDRHESIEDDALPGAKARQEALLEELRELEFDHETGVVSEAEYGRRRPELARRAVTAHEEVVELGGGRAASPDASASGRDVCGSCGASLRKGAHFCARCGAPVGGAAGLLEREPETGEA